METTERVWSAQGSSVAAALEFAQTASKLLRLRDFAEHGIHQEHVSTLVRRNLLVRLGRGLYCLPTASQGPWSFLAYAALRWPSAIVCGITASAFHGHIADNSAEIWLASKRGAGTPKGNVGDRIVKVRELAPASMAAGIETHVIDGVEVRIMNAEKAALDIERLALADSKVGMRKTLGAL